MSLKSKSIRTVIFLQGRRRGSGGGGGGMREKTGAGRWDEFYAVEDTGSSWFLKPCGFRPKKQQLKFAFCSINGIRSNTGTTEQVWESGEVGWEGGGAGNWIRPLECECEGVRGWCSPVGQDMKLLGTVKLPENTGKLIMHEGLELITAGKLAFHCFNFFFRNALRPAPPFRQSL